MAKFKKKSIIIPGMHYLSSNRVTKTVKIDRKSMSPIT
jgi:hypothetical protein